MKRSVSTASMAMAIVTGWVASTAAMQSVAQRRVADGDLPVPLGASRPDGVQRAEVNGGIIPPGISEEGEPLVFPGTRVAANGVSLRNVASGGIDLVGVPPGSVVVAAYLYWAWASLPAPLPGLHDSMILGRVPRQAKATPALLANIRPRCVTGLLIGAGGDPCWLGFGNFVYRADVTALVTGGNTYLVWLPTGAAGATNYSDPWGFPGPVGPLCEGASLVVVYTHPFEPPGTTYIYDAGLAGTLFFSDPGFAYALGGFVYPGGPARWINVGADGQSGAGYPDLFAVGLEATAFAGFPIAGPGSLYNDSDWNGSGNKPLGQLWDTSGHDVTGLLPPGAGVAPIMIAGPAGAPFDCLVAVCNVLWM